MTASLFRNYVHQACRGVTKVSGDDYVVGPLDEFAWSDSGQRISDYRSEIADGVSAGEKMRLSTVATIYEGALRLHLDREGNPVPGAPTGTAAARILGATDIVTRSPLPDDQAQIVAAMHGLTAALISRPTGPGHESVVRSVSRSHGEHGTVGGRSVAQQREAEADLRYLAGANPRRGRLVQELLLKR